jgi:hypothetical protein
MESLPLFMGMDATQPVMESPPRFMGVTLFGGPLAPAADCALRRDQRRELLSDHLNYVFQN